MSVGPEGCYASEQLGVSQGPREPHTQSWERAEAQRDEPRGPGAGARAVQGQRAGTTLQTTPESSRANVTRQASSRGQTPRVLPLKSQVFSDQTRIEIKATYKRALRLRL